MPSRHSSLADPDPDPESAAAHSRAKPTAKPEAPARVQMADIARYAGVSVSTVSRALAGSTLVNEETRNRVAELARSLNYTINVSAQNLRLKQNKTVSVVVPFDPETHQHLSDPFFLSLIGSLADALTERGYEMLLSRVPAEDLTGAAQSFDTGRAAGIVLIGQWHHHDQLNQMASRGTPFVVWGAELPGQSYATVGTDNELGGFLVTQHLLAQGAKRIGFFGDHGLPEIERRFEGWRRALREAGLPIAPELICRAPFVTEEIEAAVEAFVAAGTHFDAIFAASDLMAMSVISTLRRLGRDVPRDVLVAGYDDIELARHFHPPLTTVRQPIREAGAALVDLLLGQLAGRKARPTLLPTTLQVRDSTQR